MSSVRTSSLIVVLLSVLCLTESIESVQRKLHAAAEKQDIISSMQGDDYEDESETFLKDKLNKLQLTKELIKNSAMSTLDNDEDSLDNEKRGRFQGFCFRRSRTGRKLPYICWRDAE